jgi:hypothetical protein
MEVLTKVSFDPQLFAKELQKAFQWISREEKAILKKWCLTTFGTQKELIEACYQQANSSIDMEPTFKA